MKILNKLLFGGVLSCASVLNAELFEFSEDSTLSKDQQTTLKVLFVKNSIEGLKTFFNNSLSDEKGPLKTIIKSYLTNAYSSNRLHDLFLPYLINVNRKENDLNAVLKYNDAFDNNLINAEKSYLEAIENQEDGLFNSIIRETLKTFKKYILADDVQDDVQLTEAFNVLWNTISANEVILDFNEDFLNKISTLYPDLKLATLLESLKNMEGKNICEKITNLFVFMIQEQIDGVMETHCQSCACLKSTGDIIKMIIPMIPEILRIVLAIVTIAA